MSEHQNFAAIQATPAQTLDCGFRLLILREVHGEAAPPAFAVIDQRILRRPERTSRHAVYFASTFRPEIMAWLSEALGRPAVHDAEGRAHRNPRWPTLAWHREERSWPDGAKTTEWHVDVVFTDQALWAAFRAHWSHRLQGHPGS